jgi:hypothetical protein
VLAVTFPDSLVLQESKEFLEDLWTIDIQKQRETSQIDMRGLRLKPLPKSLDCNSSADGLVLVMHGRTCDLSMQEQQPRRKCGGGFLQGPC